MLNEVNVHPDIIGCFQNHVWHIENILMTTDKAIEGKTQLRALVKDAKRSYFKTDEYERTLEYLFQVGAIRCCGSTLRWKECNLTPSNLEFLSKTKRPRSNELLHSHPSHISALSYQKLFLIVLVSIVPSCVEIKGVHNRRSTPQHSEPVP